MIFRSFIESTCYQAAELRGYTCHDPHNNKAPTKPGILQPSAVSHNYCLDCHTDIDTNHSRHEPGTEGSFCYDCHMPRQIESIVSGELSFTHSHTMSSLPDPHNSETFGVENAPNACNECHTDQTPAWASEWMVEWWEN